MLEAAVGGRVPARKVESEHTEMAPVLGVGDRGGGRTSRFGPLLDHVVGPGDEAASFALLVLVRGVDLLRVLYALAPGMFAGRCHWHHLPLLACRSDACFPLGRRANVSMPASEGRVGPGADGDPGRPLPQGFSTTLMQSSCFFLKISYAVFCLKKKNSFMKITPWSTSSSPPR